MSSISFPAGYVSNGASSESLSKVLPPLEDQEPVSVATESGSFLLPSIASSSCIQSLEAAVKPERIEYSSMLQEAFKEYSLDPAYCTDNRKVISAILTVLLLRRLRDCSLQPNEEARNALFSILELINQGSYEEAKLVGLCAKFMKIAPTRPRNELTIVIKLTSIIIKDRGFLALPFIREEEVKGYVPMSEIVQEIKDRITPDLTSVLQALREKINYLKKIPEIRLECDPQYASGLLEKVALFNARFQRQKQKVNVHLPLRARRKNKFKSLWLH